MLRLPIVERSAADARRASIAGRQVLSEALSGALDHQEVVVKNTFLSVEDVSASARGAREVQTCTARLSSPAQGLFPEAQQLRGRQDSICSDETARFPEAEFPSSVTVLPEGCNAANLHEFLASAASAASATAAAPAAAVAAPLAAPTPGEAEDVRYVVKNTFINVEGDEPSPLESLSAKSASCTARFNGTERPAIFHEETTPVSVAASSSTNQLQPTSPPPAYPAPALPQMAGDEPPPAPLQAPKLHDFGRSLFLAALDSRSLSPGDGTGARSESSTGGVQQWIVKNTFIDIDDDEPEMDPRGAQTCLGRYVGPEPQLFPPTPADGGKQAALASMGSESHGKVDEQGQPLCQPCAWFFKQSGCLNGDNCRYCHLCPQGELKRRKKEKIARLREADAAAAAAAAASAGSDGADNPAAAAAPALPAAPAGSVRAAPAPAVVQVAAPASPAPALAPAVQRATVPLRAAPAPPYVVASPPSAPLQGSASPLLCAGVSPVRSTRGDASPLLFVRTAATVPHVPPPQAAPVFLAAATQSPPPRHSAVGGRRS